MFILYLLLVKQYILMFLRRHCIFVILYKVNSLIILVQKFIIRWLEIRSKHGSFYGAFLAVCLHHSWNVWRLWKIQFAGMNHTYWPIWWEQMGRWRPLCNKWSRCKWIIILAESPFAKGNGQKTCRYCEGRVTIAAPGSMPLCVRTYTATYVW